MWRSIVSFSLCAAFGTILVLSALHISFAQVRQSTSYKIQSDSLNFGGGSLSSPNYKQQSTFGEVGTGNISSTNYALRAGYQQMNEVYLSLSAPSNLALSPNLGGITGGVATASTTFTVITDSQSGYQLTIAAATTPAMKNATNSIANYVPAGGNPDYTFTFGANKAYFGFSPDGVNVVQRFKDNGATCNVGSLTTVAKCWDKLATTSTVIASGATSNHPLGATTTILFRVGIGSAVVQPEGVYTATTTVTAVPL